MQSGHRYYNTLWCAGQNFITLFLNGHLIVRGASYIVTTVAARTANPEVNSFIYQYSHNSNANWKRCFTDADAWAPVEPDGDQLPRAHFSRGATMPVQLI